MFCYRSPVETLRALLPLAWQRSPRSMLIRMPVWCLCAAATIAFVISSVLSCASERSSVRFWSALCAVLATTAVQKLSVSQLVVLLSYRKHSICANVVDSLLRYVGVSVVGWSNANMASNWSDSALVMVAAWSGQSSVVPAFLVGATAVNHLVLLAFCFINGGHRFETTRYPVLMAAIHARMLPAALALAVCATSAKAWPSGKRSVSRSLAWNTHIHS